MGIISGIFSSFFGSLLAPIAAPFVVGGILGGLVGFAVGKFFGKKKDENPMAVDPETQTEFKLYFRTQEDNRKNLHPSLKEIKKANEKIEKELKYAKKHELTDDEFFQIFGKPGRNNFMGNKKRKNPYLPSIQNLRKNPATIISHGSNGKIRVSIDVDKAIELDCMPEFKISNTKNTLFPPLGEPCIWDDVFAF